MKQVDLINKQDSIGKISTYITRVENNSDNETLIDCIELWHLVEKDFLNKFSADINWSNVYQLNKITKWEALLLISNLPVINYYKSVTLKQFSQECENILNEIFFKDSFEYKALNRSGLFPNPSILSVEQEWYGEVSTEEFINWTISTKLTLPINNEDDTTKSNNSHIDALNKQKRESAAYNSVVAICAYIKSKETNKAMTINSACEGDKFYNDILEDLIPMTEDGNKPSKGAIQKYLYKYQNIIEIRTS